MQTYDAIVIGAGGVGSAALCELAGRGLRVLGIDRYSPPHDRGSTHGHTRVIRQAYFEHPNYVPLLKASYRLWRDLEKRTGRRLLHEIGLIQIGAADGEVVPGVLRSAREHGLTVESHSSDEAEQRWPGLRVPPGFLAVFEPSGGYLLVEDCVRAHLDAARAAGAELLVNTKVHGWTADDHGVRVHAGADDYSAERLIIAAGSWAGNLLSELRLCLAVRRKSLFWFESGAPDYDVATGFPVFLYELPNGIFYGFPRLDCRGVKAAEHSGGQIIKDPTVVDRDLDTDELRRVSEFLAAHLPRVSNRVTDHAVCLYTMSPDEHFIVDRHPAHANVVFAAGLSGHGFKFAPVLGKALAELSIDGKTDLPIGFLSLCRFQ